MNERLLVSRSKADASSMIEQIKILPEDWYE